MCVQRRFVISIMDPPTQGNGTYAGDSSPVLQVRVQTLEKVRIDANAWEGRTFQQIYAKEKLDAEKTSGEDPCDGVDLEAAKFELIGSETKRVANLLWIKKNTFYREALDDFKEQKRSFGAKVDAEEKRRVELTNEIYNLIGFFSVFQGVILTAVTQLTQSTQSSTTPFRPLCGKVWFPVVLSGLAAVATVVGIVLKHSYLSESTKKIHYYRDLLLVVQHKETKLKQEGADFTFREITKGDDQKQESSSYFLLKAVGVIGGVVVFTAIFILSDFVIMCDKWAISGWH